MRARLGCFSTTAIISALVTAAVIGGIIYANGKGMFNPGPLNAGSTGRMLGGVTSHAATGGNCEVCHTSFWGQDRMADRCGNCHTDMIGAMTNVAKAHVAMGEQGSNVACADCHPEHQGASAPQTTVSAKVTFPHEAVGYPLSGHQLTVKNEPFACEDCHTPHYGPYDQAGCVDCHREMDAAFTQAHLLSWGGDCLACHDGVDTYNKHFDHGKVPFTLSGQHVTVDCYTCHLDARSLTDLKNTPRDCYSCHRETDPHAGSLGADCTQCHTTQGWLPSTFDHAKMTSFALTGKHVDVACENCHADRQYAGTPTTCVECHTDPHKGVNSADCEACHKTDGWTPAFDHSKSKLPLSAGHADVACETCHPNRQYAGTSPGCYNCHGYPAWHGSAFGPNCQGCHTLNGWSPARYGLGHPWFNMSHGREEGRGGGDCQTCHPSSIYEADCTTCHNSRDGGGDGGGGGD